MTSALVGQLPAEVQAAIHAAKASGKYDTPEFEAANEVFEKHFGSRAPRMGELKLPTLFVVGQYDEVRVETAQDLQARVPGSILRVIPDSGHGITRDQPQAFNEVIGGFLRSVEKR